MQTLDIGPVNVTGAFRANKARVIYEEGRLHIFQSATRHVEYDTDEPTKDSFGVWTAHLPDDTEIKFSQQGCSTCGYSLGRLTPEQLFASVGVG